MRKFFAAGFLLAFGACPLWAQVGAASSGPGGLELEIGGLSGCTASLNASLQFNGGFGGEGFVGFRLAKDLFFGVVSGYDSYPFRNNVPGSFDQGLEAGGWTPAQIAMLNVSMGGNLQYVPLMAEVKCVFYHGSFQPYGLLGFGVTFNRCAPTITLSYNGVTVIASGTASETGLLLAPGLGVKYQLDEKIDFFVQFRLDLDFTSSSNSDIGTFTFTSNGTSYSTTAPTSLTGDSPTVFIPFEAGLDFNL